MTTFDKYLERNKLSSQPHQLDGIKWCVELETSGVVMEGRVITSGILADEMGLGKTIQMIGLMLTNFKLHTLIVLPRALLEQWEHVLATTLGHHPLVYHGHCQADKQTLLASPIVLTTYGMLTTSKTIHEVDWDRSIFDEAHHLRNRRTKCHLAAVRIRAAHKWLVTGTPIQNSISDFYGLCAVLGIPQSFYVNRKNMANIVDHLVLKRTKADAGILLPDMKRTNILVKWEHEEEKQLAENVHSNLTFSRITRTGGCNSGLHYFAMLQRARQSCIDMSLMNKSLLEEFQSKINKVVEIIVERKDNGASKLVFCHYRAEIDKMKSLLVGEGLIVATFDGRTTQAERRDLIGRSDLNVLILQINTGCEGLNLQHFSEVYFVAPHWNPAVEDQAVARSHRIGQEKPVSVFSFRMESFDEDRRSQTMDGYVKQVQRVKRDEMDVIDHPDPEDVGAELMCADGESDKCAICLAEQHKHTYTRLDCGHCFHKTCIKSWFDRSTTCPTCRQ